MSDLKTIEHRELLKRYLLEADEKAVFRAIPHQIAEALALEPRFVLELLVDAMFDGDAVMHWELYCPFCTFRANEPDWLRRATHDYTCPACRNTYDVHLDIEAQATFSPHPKLRPLNRGADDPEFRQTLYEAFNPTTVYELMTVQKFRDWARDEPLPTHEYLSVRRMTVWFSDLTGSTALYARRGDPVAYDLVREHFRLIFEVIHQFEGAVVKTMGDGIMAAFNTNICATEAALVAHRVLQDFNRERALEGDRQLALKIGIHSGPSIVVNLSDRLDYFGNTVNVAARVSDLSRGTETVLTEPVQSDPEVRAFIGNSGYDIWQFRTAVKGLDRSLLLFCLVPPGTVVAGRDDWREAVKY
jgi:class 3 adenylate cyclase